MSLLNPPPIAELPPRQRILETAHLLFYRDGIRATGIDKVIAESGVAKVTFYRHFPSKHELITCYLDDRHQRWMAWFLDALARHHSEQVGAMALLPTLKEWCSHERFRGCAFINATVEFGTDDNAVRDIVQGHKADMIEAITAILPLTPHRHTQALALALAFDGAVMHVQMGMDTQQVLVAFEQLVASAC